MIFLRRREGALISVSVVLLIAASCRSQSDSITTVNSSSETVVSSTPPFKTKEPDRYRCVRTITTVAASGETLVAKSSTMRDGEMRRHDSEVASKAVTYLDVPEGKFVLLPDEKVYAELTPEANVSVGEGEETLELSPERLLHADAGNTSYQRMGTEVIGGRSANKYRIVVNSLTAGSVSQSETLMWIDEALQMPIRSETKSPGSMRITMELSEIALDVDRRVFQVPAGYGKVTFADFRKRLQPK